MPQIFVKNQLNNGLTIEFCCGDKEYQLKHDEKITIEIEDGDCLYFDIAK
jgi:3-isopropylmalate dehydratase small subunit